MIERGFAMTGYLSTALMVYGVAGLWLHPDSRWAAAVVYIGLLVLMLTPVSRVVVAGARYLRAGDRGSALLTLGILAVLALSAWVAWAR
jgi:multisubunit Na+/H+ antiporter MnhG subunit